MKQGRHRGHEAREAQRPGSKGGAAAMNWHEAREAQGP
jgi:hypothetical protein